MPKIIKNVLQWDSHLLEGAKFGDLGCGTGTLLMTLAERYPLSKFFGFDISREMLSLFHQKLKQSSQKNVSIHNKLPEDGSFDFLSSIDVIHDLAHPSQVLASVRKTLKPGGKFLSMDPATYGTLRENIQKFGKDSCLLKYSISQHYCLQSSTSKRNGSGLGNAGLDDKVVQKLCEEAGFAKVEKLQVGVTEVCFRVWTNKENIPSKL